MLLHFILSLYTFPFTMALGTLQSLTINNIAKPNCPTHCGNVTVPYPFGIGNDTGCSLDNSFYVTCDTSDGTPKLFLGSTDTIIYNISDSEFRIHNQFANRCYNRNGTISEDYDWSIELSTFTFSEKNKFTVLGCDDYSIIRGRNNGAEFSSACMGICSKAQDVADNGQCPGVGCCQTSIPKGLDSYNITLNSFQNHTHVWSFNRCGFAFIGEEDTFVFQGTNDLSLEGGVWDRIDATVPVVVDWVIAPDTRNCSESSACKENSSCYEVEGGGYRCRCNNGYEGNPYLDPGCQGLAQVKDNSDPVHSAISDPALQD